MKLLNELTPEQFLRDYWQKKPLLIRQAIPNYQCPIDANELAGLAMEEDVESRIVLEDHEGLPWQPLNGPFDEDDFNKLPDTHWTLLVQQLDAWSPEINELKQLFNFIPYWRFDDIMASYAPEGGSVGPHYDQYDVFLLQASGKRHWRIGQMCDEHSPRLEGTPLRILENFEETDGWVLEPGDMLYLPPNIAHYGVGLSNEEGNGDCITLSIGYKAPTHSQLLDNFANHLLSEIDPYAIYEDPELQLPTDANKISAHAFNKVKQTLEQYLNDDTKLKSWFGSFVSCPKNENILQSEEKPIDSNFLVEELKAGSLIYRNEGTRLFYHIAPQETENTKILLFVDGLQFNLEQEMQDFVKQLCQNAQLGFKHLSPYIEKKKIRDMLCDLINQGSFYIQGNE